MKKEYDFSKSKKNPYARKLKQQVTIRINTEAVNYFKEMAASTGIPYQSLIDLYLTECASKHKKLELVWK